MPIKRGRLFLAYLLSLLLHALLLSLAFGGGEGLGLPSFTFPWQQRSVEAPSLRVVLQPVRKAATAPVLMPSAAPVSASSELAVAAGPASPPSGSFSSSLRHSTTPIASEVLAKAEAGTSPDAIAVPADAQAEMPVYTTPAPMHHTAVIALEQSDDKTFVVPPPPPEPASGTTALPNALPLESAVSVPQDTAEFMHHQAEQEVHEQTADTAQADLEKHEAQQLAARLEAERLAAEKLETQRREAARREVARAEAARQETEHREAERLAAEKREVQRREAARQEAAQAEAARQEAEHRETERLAAEKLEAQRREATRREVARAEAARQEAERREAERLAAEKLEAQRREAARQEAARDEAVRQETERLEAERLAAEKLEAQRREAARQEAARAEAARQEAERGEAARIQEAKEEEERRLARRRAMGRQLDEEAAQRQAAATRPPLPLSLSTARRVRLWGRSDPNVELVLYAENWVRRIQLNTPIDTVHQLAGRRHTAPMVTVAVRSDGSVEAVTLVVSSGVPEVDEAIRHIVQNNVPYPPFPPRLARQYDVVEIRRTWHFDTAIRLD
ncbi:MAG: TonB family protein [Azonexus sp.]|jgi:TonB family protein|uniref:TonB family protein n=1 Tax=Azonexus sp. TaxID=1872668 RepID=UPI002824EF98|nr:TonB family protein [Azonexus sp.]MDR0775095.1 TonB family protein [Azonexus sp.]